MSKKVSLVSKDPQKNRTFLLDTSALIAFAENREGADVVEGILREASQNRVTALMSFMSFMEGYSWVLKREDEESARNFYLYLRTLPLERVDINERIIIKAGELRARFTLSVADLWIIASAIECRAVLVHCDPDYEQMEHLVTLMPLPS